MMRVFGYTNEIDELMTVADLILGKSGGLTVSEALSKGLPFVIVNPIPGQEERNADHLLEEGAALRCNSWGALSYKIGLLLHDPVRLEQMRQSALKMSRPQAAETVARELLLLAGSKEPGNVHPLDHVCDEFSLKSFIPH